MRRLCTALLALAMGAGAATAQTAAPEAATPGRLSAVDVAKIRGKIALLRLTGEDGRIPPADSFSRGDRTIPAGATVRGALGVSNGTLRVNGTIDGDAVVLGGNIVVGRGGIITGNAVALGGRVITEGGLVEGDMRSLSAWSGAATTTARAPRSTWQMVKLVLGWFAVLAIIGIGVLMFAEANLEGVVIALERGFGRAFWIGVLGQLGLLPIITLICIGLTLTVIGVLLIPFAVVAFVIAAAGLFTLGFLAIARMTGAFAAKPTAATPRSATLRAMFIGLIAYTGLWLIAALLTSVPVAAATVRGIALAVTWVAATAGFGAALASRAGTQRPGLAAPLRRVPTNDLAWQTPTPVGGVAAARRPPSASRSQAS